MPGLGEDTDLGLRGDSLLPLCGERLLARAESSTERNREVPPEGEVGEKGKRMGGLRGVLTRTFGVTIFEIPRRRGLLLECSRRGTIFTRAPSKS